VGGLAGVWIPLNRGSVRGLITLAAKASWTTGTPGSVSGPVADADPLSGTIGSIRSRCKPSSLHAPRGSAGTARGSLRRTHRHCELESGTLEGLR
jgi:hypothetical protein